VEPIGLDRIRSSAAEAQALAEQALARICSDVDEAKIIADHVVECSLL